MNSTFFGLEISRRALQAQQLALDVTGHNIANANTQGYTRQIANLIATTPLMIPGLGHSVSIGTGVSLDSITRARDAYVDRQFRWETSQQQYWATREDALGKIQGLLNEPSENSLHDDMDKFWTAWSDLSKDPENNGARAVVRERAIALTDSFHHIAQKISDMQKDLDASIRVQITQINSYARQIKDLNDQIKRAEVAGDNPNDLRDKRDQIVDELSKIVSVRVVETRDETFTDRQVNKYSVIIGDDTVTPPQTLVADGTVRFLVEPQAPQGDGRPFATVTWADNGEAVKLGDKMGSLKSNLDIRGDSNGENGYLADFAHQFDLLAQGIAQAVNAIHQTGQGLVTGAAGLDFFVTSDNGQITAANIALNNEIASDIQKIATGVKTADGTVNPGDGSIAAKISSLANGWPEGMQPAVAAASFGDFYGAQVAQMGVDVQQATRMREGEDVLVQHMLNQRESYSGVSLDEEMTNLVRFQKSYAAAARMVTVLDDMLDTIIKGMGVTR